MRKLTIIILLVSMIWILGIDSIAQAQFTNGKELIEALYEDVKIIINGRLVSPLVRPFQVEGGHLMVPIRTIGEELGLIVQWDPKEKAVYINEKEDADPMEKPQPAYVEDLTVLRNVGPFFQLNSRNITIASREFNHGLIIELAGSSSQKTQETAGNFGETVVDLQGNYSWLEGYLGVDDETRNSRGTFSIQILGDDLLIYETRAIEPSQYPFKFQASVKGVKRLTIKAFWEDGKIGDYDRLWGALANLQVY